MFVSFKFNEIDCDFYMKSQMRLYDESTISLYKKALISYINFGHGREK